MMFSVLSWGAQVVQPRNDAADDIEKQIEALEKAFQVPLPLSIMHLGNQILCFQ